MWNVSDILLRGFRLGAVCVLPCSQLPVGFHARVLRAVRAGGALNAGRARIPAGGVVDGFGQSLFFQFSGVVLRGLFLFCRSPVICEQI